MVMFACGACRGHWLDNSGSRLVVVGGLPETAREVARRHAQIPAEAGTGYRQAARSHDGPRLCPFCGEALAAATVKDAGIAVDACTHHGTWFDAAELHALAQYYEIALAEVDFEAKVLSEAIDRATRDEERAKQRRFRG